MALRLLLILVCWASWSCGAIAQSGQLTQGFGRDGSPLTNDPLTERPDEAAEAELPTDRPIYDAPWVRLRALDTVTGKLTDFDVEIGTFVSFERLEVAALSCKYPEDEISSEAYAFLRVRDKREQEIRFSGWMFASSPALSALDHPRYDVWVLNCRTE
ncbi:MAG: DUF2155 domain-containing protein [Pseudomonadota bacterium]